MTNSTYEIIKCFTEENKGDLIRIIQNIKNHDRNDIERLSNKFPVLKRIKDYDDHNTTLTDEEWHDLYEIDYFFIERKKYQEALQALNSSPEAQLFCNQLKLLEENMIQNINERADLCGCRKNYQDLSMAIEAFKQKDVNAKKDKVIELLKNFNEGCDDNKLLVVKEIKEEIEKIKDIEALKAIKIEISSLQTKLTETKFLHQSMKELCQKLESSSLVETISIVAKLKQYVSTPPQELTEINDHISDLEITIKKLICYQKYEPYLMNLQKNEVKLSALPAYIEILGELQKNLKENTEENEILIQIEKVDLKTLNSLLESYNLLTLEENNLTLEEKNNDTEIVKKLNIITLIQNIIIQEIITLIQHFITLFNGYQKLVNLKYQENKKILKKDIDGYAEREKPKESNKQLQLMYLKDINTHVNTHLTEAQTNKKHEEFFKSIENRTAENLKTNTFLSKIWHEILKVVKSLFRIGKSSRKNTREDVSKNQKPTPPATAQNFVFAPVFMP